MHRRSFLVFIVAAVAFLSACEGSGGPAVDMDGGQTFAPEELTVASGDEIVFTNTSSEAHSVTAYEDGLPAGAVYFSSGGAESESEARDNITEALMRAGETFSLTLTEPGTYRYFCIPHEDAGMVGRIVVEG